MIVLAEWALFYGERISGLEGLATGLLLAATWFGLRPDLSTKKPG
jgi:hypothetical protein